MTNLIGTIDDFGPIGLEPTSGAVLILRLDQFDPYGVSTKEWKVPVVGGAFTTVLPTLHNGSIYLRADGIAGFLKGIHFANYDGLGNITLTQLLTDRNSDGTARYLVDPATLAPLQAPPASVAQILARALQAAQDAAEAEESADRAGTSAFNAASSAASALGHANEALASKNEAVGVADSSVINATKTVSGEQYLVKLNRKNGPDIDLGDMRGLPGSTVPVGVLLGTQDLNTVTAAGVYGQANGANSTLARNYPINAAGGILEIIYVQAGTHLIQRYTVTAGANPAGRGFYERRLFNSTWSAWQYVASQRVDQTAGRAIYTWDDVNGRDQLIYGDTGWRDIATLGNSTDLTITILRVRRVGYTVFIAFDVTPVSATVAGTELLVLNLPVGFTIDAPVILRKQYMDTQNIQRLIRVNAGALLLSTQLAAMNPGNALRFYESFSTTAAWPTTLPGNASGTIPNL